jgi:ABC-type sugar transport system ATPase subunit
MLLGAHHQSIHRTVRWQEHLGEVTHVYLESSTGSQVLSNDEAWMIKVPGHASNATGERVQVSLSPSSIHVFDGRGIALERSVSDDALKAGSSI